MRVVNKAYLDNQERKKLLREIGKIDFVLVELNLYLDTHPFDQQAIEKYKKFTALKMVRYQEYEEKFGPLKLPVGNCDSREWKWATQDWPWEGGYY